MAPVEFDEPAYISGATQFFRAYFIEHDTGDDVWIQWLAYTQPPVTYYLLGGAFFITGHGEKRMGWKYWNDPVEPFFQDLLPIARMTISLFAITTILVIYILGVVAFTLPVGLAAALLTLANPIFRHQAGIAYPDIPLLLTMTLTVLLILVWYHRWGGRAIGPPLIHSVPIGMAIGISGSTRLNGALGGLVFAGFCLLIWLYSRRHERDSVAVKRRSIHTLPSLLVAALVSATVFVALNPFLYPHPLNHTEMMIRHRVSEGRNHRLMEPDKALSTASDRLRSVVDKTFYRQSSFRGPLLHWSLGTALFLLGLAGLDSA